MGLVFKRDIIEKAVKITANTGKALLIACTLLLTYLIYQPGLSGAFIFDDYPNIINNEAIQIASLEAGELKQATFSGTAGPLKRPIPMLSFALNHYLTGLDSRGFKSINLLIHCINGVLVFLLTQLLLNAYRQTQDGRISSRQIVFVSAVVMAAWLLHPINLTSVLYVVQRMNALAALFSLAGLIFYCVGRIRQINDKSGALWILASLMLATPLAVFSKENGILLPALLTVIEITIFRFKSAQGRHRNPLIALHAAIVAIPILIVASMLISGTMETMLRGYHVRDFTLPERLLTEARAFWFYISQIIAPMNTQLGIYHDDFPISRSMTDPATTSVAVISFLLLVAFAIYSTYRLPILGFGILFFIVGHSLESTILPLELIHEHRNYLPSFGLLFALVFYLTHSLKYLDTLRLRQIASILLVASFALVTAARAEIWSDPLTHITMEVDNHPESPRVNQEMGQVYMDLGIKDKNNSTILLSAAASHFKRAGDLRPYFISGLFAQLAMAAQTNQPFPNEVFEDLIRRLSNQPIPSNTVAWIDFFSKCNPNPACEADGEKITTIIQAAMSNELLKGRRKAELLTAASNHYVHTGDFQSVLYLSAEAVNTQPKDPRYRLNLVNLLIIMNRIDDAKAELEQATLDDTYGIYSSESKRLLSIINEITITTNG